MPEKPSRLATYHQNLLVSELQGRLQFYGVLFRKAAKELDISFMKYGETEGHCVVEQIPVA